jgi:TP901 family phage tail tape measure protein
LAILGAGTSIGGLTGSGSVSRLLVVVSGNTSGLSAALAGAEKSIKGFNASASQIGGALTRSLTLPLLALGGVALKLASDYASAIGRVEGLTSILDDGKHTIEEVSDDLLNLAQIVPTAPKDLADALYFAGSAGLAFGQAMQVVTLSSKAAAIGMGQASDISKVLIFALNAFEGTGLTAAHAMDVLTEGIKQGTAEPEEMAIALGRLLPIARAAGITFDQVVGSVAALTNIGVPTRVATTSLRALFSELLGPTKQATERLDQLGVSAQRLRDTLRFGPLAAFELLRRAVGKNRDALRDVLPQIRGLTAYLGLTEGKLGETKRVMDAVTHSTGALGKAFDIISKTPAFQFQISLNKLRVAGIKVGNALIPIFLRMTDALGQFGDILSSMPDGMTKMVVAAGVLAAALGPMLKLWGNLVAGGKGLFTTFKSSAIGLITMTVAAGIAIGSFNNLAAGTGGLSSALGVAIGTFTAAALALGLLRRAADLGLFGVTRLSVGLASLGTGPLVAIAAAVAGVVLIVGSLIRRGSAATATVNNLSKAFRDASVSATTFDELIENALDQSTASAEVEAAVKATADAISQLGKAGTPLKGMQNTFKELARTASIMGSTVAASFKQLDAGAFTSGSRFQGQLETGAQALQKFYDLVRQGKKADLGAIFQESGTSLDDWVASMKDLAAVVGSQDEGFMQSVKSMVAYAQAAEAAGNGTEKLKILTLGQIAATLANEQATKKLADRYGVSVSEMQDQLNRFHVTSDQVLLGGQKTMKQFGDAAFSAFGKKAMKAEAAAKAIRELNKALNETLAGNLGLFDAFDEKIKKSTTSIVQHAQAAANAALRQTENVAQLVQRGVPVGLIQEILGQGPEMVQKFADSSKGELDKLVLAYQVRLGAIDAAIVKEGDHQKGKGQDMVAGFVSAILSKEGLSRQAGSQIVNAVVGGLQSGKVKPEALDLIQSFVGFVVTSGLPKQAAGRLAAQVVQGLASGKAGPAGLKFVQSFAHSITNAKGIPQAAVHRIVQGAIRELASTKGVLPTGKKHIEAFARGIAQGKGLAKSDVGIVIAAVKQALDKGKQPAQAAGKATGGKYKEGLSSQQAAIRAWGAKLAAASTTKMKSATGPARSAGVAVGAAFAEGIASQRGAAVAEARQTAADVAAALKSASKGSPKYASYYIGRGIGQQFNEGINQGMNDKFRLGAHKVNVHHAVARSKGDRGRLVMLEGDIIVNGMEATMRGVAREEIADDYKWRGAYHG